MSYSVIIPCFNAQDYIDQALNSVLNQTVSAKEIILVDNNSTDNTLKKINDSNKEILELLLSNWDNTSNAIDNCIKVIYRIKDYFDNSIDKKQITFEYLYHFNKLFA